MNRNKGFGLFSFCFMVLLVLSGTGFATLNLGLVDRVAAPWRTDPAGQPPTTLQSWDFASPSLATTVSFNTYGIATASHAGSGNQYLSSHSFAQGVWNLDSGLSFLIPNNPVFNLQKDIYVQLIYSGTAPKVYAASDTGASQLMSQVGVPISMMPGWYHAIYQISLNPNPISETIHIIPAFNSSLYLDAIVIETQCIPEPMSLSIMGFGAILMFREKSK